MLSLRSLAVCLVVLLPSLVRAWDPYGHMMVTSVAYARLTPAAKEAVDKLAPQVVFPDIVYTPITVGCWMDDIRRDDKSIPFSGKFKRWHYVDWNLPGDAATPPEPKEKEAEDTTDTKSGDVIRGLKRAIAVLKGGSDPSIPNQAIALALVTHLTGDIHQPLHCSSYVVEGKNGKESTDQGGNRVQITNSVPFAGKRGPQRLNLHSYWDAAYRVGKDPASGEIWLDPVLNDFAKKDLEALQELMKGLDAFAPAPKTPLETNPEAWAKESHDLARDVVYGTLPERHYHMATRVEDAYSEKAKTLAKQRIVLAGYRLAVILNEAFKPAAPVTTPTPTVVPSPVIAP